MNVFTLRPSAPARKIRRAGGRAVNWLRTVISRRGAELFAMEELFRGRCLLMNVFTPRPCASARTIRRAGGRAVDGVGTVVLTNPN
jgi:hypothetical protein